MCVRSSPLSQKNPRLTRTMGADHNQARVIETPIRYATGKKAGGQSGFQGHRLGLNRRPSGECRLA
jgi:hypothetical protein